MSFASGSEVRVAIVPETAFGVTPATPAFTTSRVTSGGLRTNKTTVISDERQADRNIRDLILTGLAATGSYNFEFMADTFDDLLAGVMRGAWASNVLKNGVIAPSFTVEETLKIGAGQSFSRFPGMMVNTFSLDITAQAKVTGSMALMAMQEVLDTAPITGATYAAPNANAVANASTSVGALTVGTITPTPRVKSLKFEINNGLRTRPAVGTPYTAEFGADRCAITGSVDAYFESNDLYQAVLAHGSAALAFTIGAEANKRYTFLFPKIRFGDGARTIGGNNEDVMVSIPFQAVLDPTAAASLVITRAVA